jgi:hypothetical protein
VVGTNAGLVMVDCPLTYLREHSGHGEEHRSAAGAGGENRRGLAVCLSTAGVIAGASILHVELQKDRNRFCIHLHLLRTSHSAFRIPPFAFRKGGGARCVARLLARALVHFLNTHTTTPHHHPPGYAWPARGQRPARTRAPQGAPASPARRGCPAAPPSPRSGPPRARNTQARSRRCRG